MKKLEIEFTEFKRNDKSKYQITGTIDGWCISDLYNRDSIFWQWNRKRAEKRIIKRFIGCYQNDIKEAYKNYITK